jgi:hypothetical protein
MRELDNEPDQKTYISALSDTISTYWLVQKHKDGIFSSEFAKEPRFPYSGITQLSRKRGQ